MDEWLAYFIPSWISIGTSSFFLGCAASSRSFAESLSVRAVSTGPKTRLFNLALFAFLVLARAPFAMVDNRWSTNQSTWDLDGKVLNIKQQKNLRFFGYFWRAALFQRRWPLLTNDEGSAPAGHQTNVKSRLSESSQNFTFWYTARLYECDPKQRLWL